MEPANGYKIKSITDLEPKSIHFKTFDRLTVNCISERIPRSSVELCWAERDPA